MLEFKTIEILKPNKEIIEIIKNYNYKTKMGGIAKICPFSMEEIYENYRFGYCGRLRICTC